MPTATTHGQTRDKARKRIGINRCVPWIAAMLVALAAFALLATAAPAKAQNSLGLTTVGEWATPTLGSIAVDDPSLGDDRVRVYSLDLTHTESDFDGIVRPEPRVLQYSSDGTLLREWKAGQTAAFDSLAPGPAGIALDPASHLVYAAGRTPFSGRGLLFRWDSNGQPLGFRNVGSSVTGVAVDPRTGTEVLSHGRDTPNEAGDIGNLVLFDFGLGFAPGIYGRDRRIDDIVVGPTSGPSKLYAVSDRAPNDDRVQGGKLFAYEVLEPDCCPFEPGPQPSGAAELVGSVATKGANGVAVDNSGNVFVSYYNRFTLSGGIEKYSPALELQGEISVGFVPGDIAIGADDTLYVAAAFANHDTRIVKYRRPEAVCCETVVLQDGRPALFTRRQTISFGFIATGTTGTSLATFGCQLDRRGKRNRRERRLSHWRECEPPTRYRRLRSGHYTFIARAFNEQGAPDETPERVSFTVDRRRPRTHIVRGPDSATRRHRARFKFRSNNSRTSFECRLDRRRWKPCSAPKKSRIRDLLSQGLGVPRGAVRVQRDVVRYRGMKRGRHVFRVRAVDRAGNRDRSPARRVFRVVRRDKR